MGRYVLPPFRIKCPRPGWAWWLASAPFAVLTIGTGSSGCCVRRSALGARSFAGRYTVRDGYVFTVVALPPVNAIASLW